MESNKTRYLDEFIFLSNHEYHIANIRTGKKNKNKQTKNTISQLKYNNAQKFNATKIQLNK